MKVKDFIKNYDMCGICIQTKSEQFGTHWYLIINHPAKYFYDRIKFAKLSNGSVLYWDSMKEDEVLKTVSVENFHKMGEIRK